MICNGIPRHLIADDLILLLRNQHFYPIGTYMNKIADAVTGMYASKGEQHEEFIFDDKAVLASSLDERRQAQKKVSGALS